MLRGALDLLDLLNYMLNDSKHDINWAPTLQLAEDISLRHRFRASRRLVSSTLTFPSKRAMLLTYAAEMLCYGLKYDHTMWDWRTEGCSGRVQLESL